MFCLGIKVVQCVKLGLTNVNDRNMQNVVDNDIIYIAFIAKSCEYTCVGA